MNGILILKSLGYSNKVVPGECQVWAQIMLCVPTSAVKTQDSAAHLPAAATEDSDLSFLRAFAPALSFTQNPFLWYLQSQAASCPSNSSLSANSSEMPFRTPAPTQVTLSSLWSPAHPLYFLCQPFISCSRFVPCVCHWVLSFSNQVCPYIIVSLALSRMACNRCSLHILGLTEWIGNLWRKKEKYCSWKEQKCTESNFLI